MKANKLWGVVAVSLLTSGAAAAQDQAPGAQEPATAQPAPARAPAVTTSPSPQKGPGVDEWELAPPSDDEGYLSRLPIDLAGYYWNDIGFLGRINDAAGQYNQDANYMQGRFVLQAAYERAIFGTGFARAQAQFMGLVNEYSKSQYEPHTLDAYLQVGQRNLWDVQVGRFLAWEVYRRGQGIELYTAEEAGAGNAPPMYWLQVTRGLRNEAGQGAVHYYPLPWLGFELAGVYGQESNQNNLGVRPAAYAKVGGLLLVAGAEYQRQKPQQIVDEVSTTTKGWAARAEYKLLPVTLGLNYAQGSVDATDINGDPDTNVSATTRTLGAYADVDVSDFSLGLGFHRTLRENEREDFSTHNQAFASLLYKLPVKGLSAKLVGGYARGRIEDQDVGYVNSMRSVRVRLRYDFY